MFDPNISISHCDLYLMISDIKDIGCIIMMIWVLCECWSQCLTKPNADVLCYCLAAYIIRKTCPCNEYPFKPHFYIAKLGYAGVYLYFFFLLQNIDCGYSLEPPR